MNPYRLFRMLRKLRLQDRLNWTARVGALKVPLLGSIGGETLSDVSWESWKIEFLRRLRSLGEAPFLDVGANVGQTLLQYVRSGPLNAPYLAFEPNVYCAHYLWSLAKANALDTVDIYPCALHSMEGFAVLELGRDEDASGSVVPDMRPGRTIQARQRVATFSLDFLLERQMVPLKESFNMKIDVEGAELDVIRGARRTIESLRPVVQCEVLWAHSAATATRVDRSNAELAALLASLRYRIYRLALDRDQTRILGLEPFGEFPSALYQRGINSHQCEYLFLPQERADEVLSAISGRE